MSWDDLRWKFPELEPIDRVPAMGHIMGCGFMLYGDRGEDPETRTTVRTRCFCILGIPLLALGAYRVVNTPEGVAILGKEPISKTASLLNFLVLLAALGGGGYYGFHRLTTSEWYVAREHLQQADRLAQAGSVGEAASSYKDLIIRKAMNRDEARSHLRALALGPDARWSAEETARLFSVCSGMEKLDGAPATRDELHGAVMSRVSTLAESDPRSAVIVLESAPAPAAKAAEVAKLQKRLLERVVAQAPGDVAMVSRLAVICEAEDDLDRAAKLLEPLRDKLGDSEGARVLGMIDSGRDRLEPAINLLRAYTRPRLLKLRRAEGRLTTAVKQAQERLVERIKSGEAHDFDYASARRATIDEANRMYNDYLRKRIEADPELDSLNDEFIAETAVGQAALDLGMLLMRQGRLQNDPETRKREFSEAEETLLAVQRIAGGSRDYQLSLGQVYYWEGKTREGRAEFDKLLGAHPTDAGLMLEIARRLRDVGGIAEARELAEKGFQSASPGTIKSQAAILRAIIEPDRDARIEWMQKAQSTEPFDRAILSAELASKSLSEGDEASALSRYREAARLYDSLPDSSPKLNNAYLVQRQIARLSGDMDAFRRAEEMIERAIKFDPESSVTLRNAARTRFESALRKTIGAAIDYALLKQSAGLEDLAYLYDADSERSALRKRLSGQPDFARFVALQEKVIFLSPRDPESFMTLARVYEFLDDAEALRALGKRVATADFALESDLDLARERSTGVHDKRDLASFAAIDKRREALVAAARESRNPATLACAISGLMSIRSGEIALGAEQDRDELVALAEEAYKVAPSRGSRGLILHMLAMRAESRLAKALPDYAKVFDRTRRSVSASERIAAILSTDGPLTSTVAADPDVKRIADLALEDTQKRPHAGGVTWALLRVHHPEAAKAIAEDYQRRETPQLLRAIHARAEPYDPSTALGAFWSLTLAGKPAAAASALKTYLDFGLPLPIGDPP